MIIYQSLYNSFDRFVPKRRLVGRAYLHWFTREIITNIKLKEKYRTKYLKFGLTINDSYDEHLKKIRSSTITDTK